MKKILIAETNVRQYKGADIQTGIWLDEVTTPYDMLTKAGFKVDFASPEGGAVPVDPHSMQMDDKTKAIFESADFKTRALENTQKLADVNPESYAAVFFAGGHGAMWDFPDCEGLQNAAVSIIKNGGFVGSICHGEVGLLNLKDDQGNYLIAGKKINGFTDKEEAMNGTADKVPFAAEEELKKRGCVYVKGEPFTAFAVRDGQFITGQNPMSAEKVTELLIEALKEI